MATEEYSIGYSEGYQEGWNAAMDSTPPAAQPAPVQPVGDWVWSWLMNWCLRNGIAPATQNSLFEMVKDARGKFKSTPHAEPVPLTDELSNAVQMACQLSFKDHGRRSVNEQAWQRLMQAVAAYTHGITKGGAA